jgi:hypothetical protein
MGPILVLVIHRYDQYRADIHIRILKKVYFL